MYQDPNEPKSTSYAATMKGLQIFGDNRAEILMDGRTSLAGNTLPDPSVMSKIHPPLSCVRAEKM